MKEPKFRFTQRNLSHWELDSAVYLGNLKSRKNLELITENILSFGKYPELNLSTYKKCFI